MGLLEKEQARRLYAVYLAISKRESHSLDYPMIRVAECNFVTAEPPLIRAQRARARLLGALP